MRVEYFEDTACWMYVINEVRYGSFLTEQDAVTNAAIHKHNMDRNKLWTSQVSGSQRQPDKPSSKLSYFRRMRKTTLRATGITSTLMEDVLSAFAENVQIALDKGALEMEPHFDSKGLLTSVNLVAKSPTRLHNLLTDAIERADYRSKTEGRRIGFER